MILLIPIAFISGILTVFSPCVLPILPIILASGIDGNSKRIKGLISGLIISFTVASLLLATFVQLLGIPADTIRLFAVGLLIIFGLSLTLPNIWSKIQATVEKYWHIKPHQTKNSGFWGGFTTGVSLGIVWTPCVGPIIATVATLAAINSLSLSTVFISLAYAIGTGVPLYFIAQGGKKISSKLNFIKKENQKIRQIFGLIVLASALFIWSGADRLLQAWTLKKLPEAWTQAPTVFEKKFNLDSELNKLNNQSQSKSQAPKTIINKNIKLQNNFTEAKISPKDLIQGCNKKDCIPSIDHPIFETSSQADKWLNPTDIVFAIKLNGVIRAYPQKIMNWHEIVNDKINGTPIAITFCPLCGSALGFERIIEGITTELGISGKLHNNDLVMYDRYQGNLWQQITGEAIVGPAAQKNLKLKKIPIITVEWEKWKSQQPNTQVLSRQTGYTRNYDQYPYGTYEQNDELLFGVKQLNRSLQIKTVVYGIELNNTSKAYPESAFDANPIIKDTIENTNIQLEKKPNGKIIVTNLKTEEQLIPTRVFWFAWAAFHPDTKLYSN